MSDVVTNFFTEENKDLGAVLLNKVEFQDYLNKINGGIGGNSSGGGTTFVNTGFEWGLLNPSDYLYNGSGHSTPVQIQNSNLNNGIPPSQILEIKDLSHYYIYSDLAYSAILDGNNKLWVWGISQYFNDSPTCINVNHSWSRITLGFVEKTNYNLSSSLLMGIKTDGSLWHLDIWTNTNAVLNQIGTDTDWKEITSNGDCAAAIKTDGTLWSWGSGLQYAEYQLLGRPDNQNNVSIPTQIGVSNTWKTVDFGSRTAHAIKTDGTLWGWGWNDSGQIGNNSIFNKSSPVQIGNGTTWKQISHGDYHTVSIKTDGTLWAWGDNGKGQLGIGSNGLASFKSSPVQIGTNTNWSLVKAGGSSTLAIKTDGTLWAWGDNGKGQLGIGNTYSKSSPVQVGTDTTWTLISCSSYYSAAVKTN